MSSKEKMIVENAYTRDAIIIRFRDGDTVIIAIECNHCHCLQQGVLRLQHIDSYEPADDTEAMAEEIARLANEQFRGKIGKLIPNKSRHDRYGRLIGDILLEGELLSNLLVKAGLAWYGVGTKQPNQKLN